MHRSLEHEKAALEHAIRSLDERLQKQIDALQRRVEKLEQTRQKATCTLHEWELRDERAPHMGYRCKKCGIIAAR